MHLAVHGLEILLEHCLSKHPKKGGHSVEGHGGQMTLPNENLIRWNTVCHCLQRSKAT